MDPEVFREYDIRGIADRQFDSESVELLGRAIGTTVRRGGGRTVVVGRDHRASGVRLEEAIVTGLLATGCDAIVIGVTPTPVGYWAVQALNADGGVQITGSHNPPEYNGFKLTLLGVTLFGPAIQDLRRMIEQRDFASGQGQRSSSQAIEPYLDELATSLRRGAEPFKVVVDAGNGTGGLTAVPLLERLGYEVVPLYCEPDASFPNHHPDPTVEANLADLRAAVARERADLGVAFDGDADRIGVVDRHGDIIWGDRLLTFLARGLLEELPGATVIGEVKCSKTLYDDIAAHGGQPLMWKTGHSLIKAKMKETGAALAGEMSGHIFYAHRYRGFDDAVYAAGRLLERLPKAGIQAALADLPVVFSTPEIRVNVPESQKFALVARLVDGFRADAARQGFRLVDIDGARLEWPDGFGLVRASNTTPLLVLRFEATTRERVAEIQAYVEAAIERHRQGLAG